MTGDPVVDEVRAAAYRIPAAAPEADATLRWTSTTWVLVWVRTGELTGLGWTYAHEACVPLITGALAPLVEGRPVLDVPARWTAMQRAVRNLGRPGLVSCALSAVDTALWDAAARVLGIPLARLLGRVHEEVAVYGSGGFTNQPVTDLHAQLATWVHDQDMDTVKIKIGEDRGCRVNRDLARMRTAREVIGDEVALFVDANGGYAGAQARRLAPMLDQLGVSWFEEPVSSDDLAGLATVRAATSADVAAGEYGYDLPYFARMIEAGAVDCLQVDVTRCGGYTEWRRVAALAAAANLEVSAHCAPNLAAHAAVATPNARHLEWFVDHDRIETTYLDGALDPTHGRVRPEGTAAGNGLAVKVADLAPYAVA